MVLQSGLKALTSVSPMLLRVAKYLYLASTNCFPLDNLVNDLFRGFACLW